MQVSPPEEWWPGSNLQELLQREDLLQLLLEVILRAKALQIKLLKQGASREPF
jgi:hypothetical protein